MLPITLLAKVSVTQITDWFTGLSRFFIFLLVCDESSSREL